ncbi:MAG: 23S rRNA (pseudouridine(1915)-N(3))-methyltransferase RlmH [Ruminococcaceae bacterium]|nr:23S rRNA (pseudouridine(1915)-N(3))-methyltransferase RlmH [Oscillospiraceae bacterium]
MQIELICIGKLKEAFWKSACTEYSKRLSRFCRLRVTELKDEAIPETASAAQVEHAVMAEGERILERLLPRDYVISLCVEGKPLSSPGLAKQLQDICQSGAGRLVFVIGGSCGLSEEVKKRSQFRLSFSAMTFPHQLMRVILLEQVYRAFKINAGESYHK